MYAINIMKFIYKTHVRSESLKQSSDIKLLWYQGKQSAGMSQLGLQLPWSQVNRKLRGREEKMSARRKERADGGNKEFFTEEEGRSNEEKDLEEEMTEAASSTETRGKPGPSKQQIILIIPEAVDDFLRNFLRRTSLSRTLNSFESEWYNSAQKLLSENMTKAATGVFLIPDALTHRQLLQNELETVHRETELIRPEVLVTGNSLLRMQRERDFHRLRYRQVAEEKNRLIEDFKRLKIHLQSYEPAVKQLKDEYQAALRHKMLISLKKDKVKNSTKARLNQEKSQLKKERSIKMSMSIDKSLAKRTTTRHPKDIDFSVCSRLMNSQQAQVNFEKLKNPSPLSLSCSIRAHKLPISCIDLHPRKQILASASDDCSWRLWALPANEEKVRGRVFWYLNP